VSEYLSFTALQVAFISHFPGLSWRSRLTGFPTHRP